MSWQYSELGLRLGGESGIVQLMDDLGSALSAYSGRTMRMLGGGNPAHIPEVEALWRRRLAEIAADGEICDAMLGNYDAPAGSPAFLKAFAALLRESYGWDVGPENLAVTPGGQAAFFFLFSLLAGKNLRGQRRRILLPLVPEYIGYADQGIEPETFCSYRPKIESVGEHRFKYRIDFDSLEVNDETAAICVSRPTNPSGNVLTDDEIDRLAQLAKSRGIPLIIDNAYGIPFPNALFEPITPVWNSNLIMTFSLSKLGLPGTRTGIVLGEPEIVRRIRTLTGIVGLANNNVGQKIVEPLLANGELTRTAKDLIRPYYQQKSAKALQLVDENLADHFPYAVHVSEGAFFLWLWFPELPITSRELYKRLKERGVLVVPGEYFFYGLETADGGAPWLHSQQCLRMTFSQGQEVVEEGIAIMADELRRLHG